MSDAVDIGDESFWLRWRSWLHQWVAKPSFQAWAARFPVIRTAARSDGQQIFDLIQGFVSSQVLMALVELDVFHKLRAGPVAPARLGVWCNVPEQRMTVLCQAGAALGLLTRMRDGRFGLARKGAALIGVPGLEPMIRHHRALYDDLRDPVALLRGPDQTQLSAFWPYVFGAAQVDDPEVAATYSDLMAQSQLLVADDTLRAIQLDGVSHLMDIGGGTGAFLEAVGAQSKCRLTLFDLPHVVSGAQARFNAAGLQDRCNIVAGSFRDDPLPVGADAISLVRVLYDHADDTVRALLRNVRASLPPGGRLIISEPMSGGTRPERSGDVYFAFYTMAMQTGRVRSAAEISDLCAAAGFVDLHSPSPARPFVTRVLTARVPER